MSSRNESIMEEPLFLGEFEHALDAQCRVSIPGDWRRGDGQSSFVLLPARDKALVLLPAAIFREFVDKARKLAVANPKVQMAFALIGAQARQCRYDKQGRMPLERKMLDAIGVKGQLKLIGALNHIRLCAPENWVMPDAAGLEAQLDEMQKISEDSGDLAALLSNILNKGAE